jgi:hypothetical protein
VGGGRVEPSGDCVVIRSTFVETREEARAYYRAKLASPSPHSLTCRGVGITVSFDREATHLYSEEVDGPIPAHLEVKRWQNGSIERRQFSLKRARAMDLVIPAICKPALAHRAQGTLAAPKWLLHGFPILMTQHRMRVVLRSIGPAAWACVSAYAVKEVKFHSTKRSAEKFPP